MHHKSLLLFYLLLYSVYGTSSYTSSFTDVVSGSVKTNCDFNLTYTDSKFTNTEVSCERLSKGKITVDYVHEAKSMHVLTLRLKILKSGTTRVQSSSVEKSKYLHILSYKNP